MTRDERLPSAQRPPPASKPPAGKPQKNAPLCKTAFLALGWPCFSTCVILFYRVEPGCGKRFRSPSCVSSRQRFPGVVSNTERRLLLDLGLSLALSASLPRRGPLPGRDDDAALLAVMPPARRRESCAIARPPPGLPFVADAAPLPLDNCSPSPLSIGFAPAREAQRWLPRRVARAGGFRQSVSIRPASPSTPRRFATLLPQPPVRALCRMRRCVVCRWSNRGSARGSISEGRANAHGVASVLLALYWPRQLWPWPWLAAVPEYGFATIVWPS